MEHFFAFVAHHWLLWSGFVLVLFLLLSYEFASRHGGAASVSPGQAVQLMNKQEAVIFDIRNQQAFDAGHIRDAYHVVDGNVSPHLKKLVRFKTKPVIVVGEMGAASVKTVKAFIAEGFAQCHVLQGGMQAWRDANLPLVKSEPKTKAKGKTK